MTLTQEQRQALREKAASAKTQSKLQQPIDDEAVYDRLEEVRTKAELQSAGINASRETYPRIPTEGVDMLADERVGEFEKSPTVDDIPWDGSQALTVSTIDVPVFVEGFRTHGLTVEQIEDAAENLQTYLNVKVRHVSEFIGRELRVIGCANVPLEGNVTDRNTGEVAWMKWVQPRWKLAAKDEMTGQHVVLHGGGSEALRLVRLFTALYGPGDWKQPKKVTFTMETRDNGHILYHISHWRIRDVE